MSRSVGLALAMVIVATVAVGAGGRRIGAAEPSARRAVLLELFTSQGCSSCPPADRLLSRLGSAPEWQGRVVPLAYHVDYWNYIGWRDPFSSAAWSARQQAYARASRNGRVYTPQAVIDGRTDLVGSDEARLLAALADAASQAGAEIQLDSRRAARALEAEISIAPPPQAPAHLELFLAVFEMGLETPVGRGENRGHTLRNDHVVRRLERVAGLAGPGPTRHRHAVPLDPAWKPDRLGVAVFVQDPETLIVWGATATQP